MASGTPSSAVQICERIPWSSGPTWRSGTNGGGSVEQEVDRVAAFEWPKWPYPLVGDPQGLRDVASTRSPSARGAIASSTTAQASTRCSQLSSTRTPVSDSASSASPVRGSGPGSNPMASATACATRSGFRNGASSAVHTPSPRRAAASATSVSSRVLPTPPGPVTVISPSTSSHLRSPSSSSARPTNRVVGSARSRMSGATSHGSSAGTRSTPPPAVRCLGAPGGRGTASPLRSGRRRRRAQRSRRIEASGRRVPGTASGLPG